MRISKLPFPNSFKIPNNFQDFRTSDLLERGVFFSFKNPGLPFSLPIGSMVRDNLTRLVRESHEGMDALHIEIPSYMKREVLNDGTEIQDTFERKFVTLPSPMEKYIGLTTHEMEIVDWLNRDTVSYRTLPLRLFFYKSLLRPIKDPRGILKLREFEVCAMLSLDEDRRRFGLSLNQYESACEGLFDRLGIKATKRKRGENVRRGPHLDFDLEYFYKCPEGDNVNWDDQQNKALSLAMGYEYVPRVRSLKFTNDKNENVFPVLGSFSMGIERMLYSAFDASRDSRGFDLPEEIRPFDTSVLMFGDSEDVYARTREVYEKIRSEGGRVLLDDRRTRRTTKAKFSDYIGVPKKIIVSSAGVREVGRDEVN